MSRTGITRALVISDGRPGHFNQSIALCRLLGVAFVVVEVSFGSSFARAVSHVFDFFGLRYRSLFRVGDFDGDFQLVVSAGSRTYYANKVLAAKLGVVLLKTANEDHDLAAFRKRFLDELAAEPASVVITHANVHEAVGIGGIGIVRISGIDAASIAEELLGSLPPPRAARLYPFRDGRRQVIDQGPALLIHAIIYFARLHRSYPRSGQNQTYLLLGHVRLFAWTL